MIDPDQHQNTHSHFYTQKVMPHLIDTRNNAVKERVNKTVTKEQNKALFTQNTEYLAAVTVQKYRCQWECSYSLQAASKDLRANLLLRPL